MLSFGAEYFVLQFAIQKFKDVGMVKVEWPRGFLEFKVPRLHDNGTG